VDQAGGAGRISLVPHDQTRLRLNARVVALDPRLGREKRREPPFARRKLVPRHEVGPRLASHDERAARQPLPSRGEIRPPGRRPGESHPQQ